MERIPHPFPGIPSLGVLVLTISLIGIRGLSAQEVNFNRDIRPILSDRCFACHGPDAKERKADLRLDIAEGPDGAYRTLDGSTAIQPGSPEKSEVWARIISEDEDDVMPPPESHKPPLSDSEKALVKRWIEQGAPYEAFWAFVPLQPEDPPAVKDADWSSRPIDRFVLARLESLDRSPSPPADRRALIRRVTFDLTGLPPTREEIAAFLADEGPDAYEQLVDRLLASPRYGEHFARYWLDLVRFADTNGMHKDFYRNLYPYRDWVIRTFNENLGYDDFVRHQLAGDLFDEPTRDQLIASGFHRLHLIIDRGTALPEESYTKNVFDRVEAFGTAFLGLTVTCAQCHDHKYDPLTQSEYYSLFAFFNNFDGEPETAGRPRNGLQPPFLSLATPEQEQKLAEMDRQIAAAQAEVNAAKKAVEAATDPAAKKPLTAELKKKESALNTKKKERQSFDDTIPKAMVMRERAEVRPAYFLNRGQYDDQGEEVTRLTPAFLPPLETETASPSRRDLAEWLLRPDHPLTARVAVNRFWQQFFGVGLVKTSEDLGAQGEVPSHPALLDHLALSFVESGWDVKALVREIVLSETYRQQSAAPTEEFENDPENRLLARGSRYRMDAEMIRDQILSTSGLLSEKMHGRSVKPPQPDGLWKAVTMTGERFSPDSGEDIFRRSVYTYWKRGMPPPQMTILNAPIRDACIARRERTNTPAQALLLLNESEYFRAARTLAETLLSGDDSSPAKLVDAAWETVTSQLPDASEREDLLRLIEDLEKSYRESSDEARALLEATGEAGTVEGPRLAAWTVAINTLYNLDVTKTRQ